MYWATKSSPKTDEIITEKKVVELSIDKHKKKESKKDWYFLIFSTLQKYQTKNRGRKNDSVYDGIVLENENMCPKKAIINGTIISRPKQTDTKKRVCLILVIFDKITKNAATLIKGWMINPIISSDINFSPKL